jgi:hypothetical protein
LEIVVEGEEVSVSTLTLCRESPVFKEMLMPDFEEENNNKIKTSDWTYRAMLAFVQAIHKEIDLDKEYVFIILSIIHKYRCQGYLQRCKTVFNEMIDSTTLQLVKGDFRFKSRLFP